MKLYKIYMLRCADNSIYTGICTDFEKRFGEHKSRKGAKFTRILSKHPLKLGAIFETEGRSNASKIESFIKKLNKNKKEMIIQNNQVLIDLVKVKLEIHIKIFNR